MKETGTIPLCTAGASFRCLSWRCNLPQERHNELRGEDTSALAVPILVLLNQTNLLTSKLPGEEDLNLQKTKDIHNTNI